MRTELSVNLDLALNAEQDGVVHNVAARQKRGILLDCIINSLDILGAQVYLLHVMLVQLEVLVFQSRRVLSAPLHKSTERTSFEVVDARDVVFVIEAQSVAHQHQVDLLVVFDLNRVDAIYATEE